MIVDTWLILLIIGVLLGLAAAGYGYYRYKQSLLLPPPPEPVPIILLPEEAEPLGYTTGRGYMISLGIGRPAEIPAFTLFGLAVGAGATPPSGGAKPHRHIHIAMRAHI